MPNRNTEFFKFPKTIYMLRKKSPLRGVILYINIKKPLMKKRYIYPVKKQNFLQFSKTIYTPNDIYTSTSLYWLSLTLRTKIKIK